MKRLAALALASLTALMGCSTEKESESTTAPADTSTPSSDSTDASGTTGTTSSDPRAPGVTDTEVKVGIMYTDFTDIGPLLGYDQGDIETAYNAIIDDINANGGIHGRQIVPVFAPTDPSVTDGPATACTKLTEDDDVFVVVGFLFEDSPVCVAGTGETLAIGGNQTAERLAQVSVGWWTLESGDDFLVQSMQKLADDGKFSTKLTVVGTSGDQPIYEQKIKPILDAAGVTPLEVAYFDPTNDVEKTYSDAQTIAERFKSAGSDQVLMLSVGSTFPTGMARTDWRPQLIFSSVTDSAVYSSGEGNDLSLLEGALAPGSFDASNEYESLGSPTAECMALQEAAGLELMPLRDVPEGGSQQITSSLIACRYMALLVAGLEAAGPTLDNGTFTDAMNSLGEVMLPGWPDPLNFGPGDATDGNPPLYIFEWDADLERMVVSGG